MGLAIIHSRASVGVEAPEVTVEVHISNGMPGFTLVGLPETTVKESKDRVRSALIHRKESRSTLLQRICQKRAGVLIYRLRLEF